MADRILSATDHRKLLALVTRYGMANYREGVEEAGGDDDRKLERQQLRVGVAMRRVHDLLDGLPEVPE